MFQVTFGGATSRIISDQSDLDESQGRGTPSSNAAPSGGDNHQAPVLNPTTPRTPGLRAVRRLTTPSPTTAANGIKTATVKPVSPKDVGAGGDAGDVASVHQPYMTKKFAELKAKNDAKKAEKAKEREEMKAKYGNRFNMLKAKNEERARQKEAAKAKAAAAARSQEPADDDSSGCDWF